MIRRLTPSALLVIAGLARLGLGAETQPVAAEDLPRATRAEVLRVIEAVDGEDTARFIATGRTGRWHGVTGAQQAFWARDRLAGGGAADEAVVVLPGYSETWVKYSQVLERLAGLSADGGAVPRALYIYDHRGMGLSQRLTAHPQKIHVDDFDAYVEDALTFIRLVVRPARYKRLHLLCHSTGCPIGLLANLREPDLFATRALNAPLLGVHLGGLPRWFVRGLVGAATGLGLGRWYAPGHGAWDPDAVRPEESPVTTDRQQATRQLEIARRLPASVSAGASMAWVRATLDAVEQLQGQFGDLAQVPTVLFQAGDDSYVTAAPQERFCQATGARLRRFSVARHELLMETSAVRHKIFDSLQDLWATGRP